MAVHPCPVPLLKTTQQQKKQEIKAETIVKVHLENKNVNYTPTKIPLGLSVSKYGLQKWWRVSSKMVEGHQTYREIT